MTSQPIRNLILDMDGVLWRGDTPIPGLVDFFEMLRHLQIGFVLATNNATRTAAQYTQKLAHFGVSVKAEQILTSAEAAAAYLNDHYPANEAIFIVGDIGLHEAVAAKGFTIRSPDEVRLGAMVAAVVVGLSRNVTYDDLAMGTLLILKGATFIGTNPDPTFPSEWGPLPGAGALLAALQASTGVEPLIIGKPGRVMFEEAVRRLGGDATSIAMVGDRLSTDIAGAAAVGLKTVLVLTGISTADDIADSPVKPDYVFADINELGLFLQTSEGFKTLEV
jgi:4-nitrophenyl phosphatase